MRDFVCCYLVVALCLPGCASTPKKAPAAPPATSANVGTTTIVAIAAPASSGPSTTLPKLLGLDGLAAGICGLAQRVGSRLANSLDLTGRFPDLQPQPPLLALTDPANLEPDAPPAVQAAAEIKAEEDAAPQKIMAIRYLATLGCGGCYEKVEDALLQGMSDCTEAVRFEAVKALECRPDSCCKYCSSPSCCSPAVRKRLEELTTCEHEQSTRIRRSARLALACCNAKPLKEEDVPREGPPAAPILEATAPIDPPQGRIASNSEPVSKQPSLSSRELIASLAGDMQSLNVAQAPLPTSSMPASSQQPASSIFQLTSASLSTEQFAPTAQSFNQVPDNIQLAASVASLPESQWLSSELANVPEVPNSAVPKSDRLLARVNGLDIYASHIQGLPKTDTPKQSMSILETSSSSSSQEEANLLQQLQRAIDWTLLHQQAQLEILGHNAAGQVTAIEVQAWLERKVVCDPAVAPTETFAWYQIHQQQYRLPARVKWECISVLVDKCASREQAVAIAAYLRRKALGENLQPPEFMARSMVEAKTHDWCDIDKLNTALEQSVLAGLPLGSLSQVMESDNRLHLYRVIERETERTVPLAAVAGQINDEIIKQRGRVALDRYLASLRSAAQIWIAPELLQSSSSSGSLVGVVAP